MKFLERIKTLIKKSKSQHAVTTVIFEKQCPHCSSRGMFTINSTSISKTQNGELNEKHK
jgi:hypothetical protein